MTPNSCKCVKIIDDSQGFDPSLFAIDSRCDEYLKSILIPHGLIMDRIEKMALDIVQEKKFVKNGIVAIGVLKGGYKFFSKLTEAIRQISTLRGTSVPIAVQFIKVQSYFNEHSGNVKVTGMEDLNILTGKDMIDTGKTIVELLKYLETFKPASLKVASMTLKRTPLNIGYTPDYVGFETPDKFLVGFGLDYNENFRELNHICVINKEGIEYFSVKK